MRALRLLCAFLLCAALPLAATAAEKAKTVEELAKISDSSRCKECHDKIHAQWEKSHHGRSLMGVQGGLMMTPLAIKGGTAFSPDDPSKATLATFPCFKCHLPQALTKASDAFAADFAKALVAQDKKRLAPLNINCLTCHNEKAIIHRLELGQPQPNVLYGTRDVPDHPDDVYKVVKRSEVMASPLFCGQCHGMGPNLEFENPVQCATLYGSYQHSYVSQGGAMRCQDCHMPEVDGERDHLMPPNWDDIDLMSKRLAKAVYLDVQTVGYEWLRKSKDLRPTLVVNTKIWQNAGHRIPDG